MSEALLDIRDLKKYFPVIKGLVFQEVVALVKAVDGVSYTVNVGETVGLVGESGCGKTTTMKMLLLLEKPTSGSIIFRGQDIHAFSAQDLRKYRHGVQAVFQDPYSSLNPRMRVGDIISEPLVVNEKLSKAQVKERVQDLLRLVGLRPASSELFPHEFSGGQRQRIAIARALSLNPSLIILDEPVSALDVSIRAQIMNLLQDLQEQFNVSYLLIAHDLAAILHLSTTVVVMYLGKIVELGTSDQLRVEPMHPYSKALFAAALPVHPDEHHAEVTVTGEIPSPLNPPSGCRFHPRCPFAKSVCSEVEPPLTQLDTGHLVACHLYTDAA